METTHQTFPTDIVIKQTLFQVQNDGEYRKSDALQSGNSTPMRVKQFLVVESQSDFSDIQYNDSINDQYTAIIDFVNKLYKDALGEGSFEKDYIHPIRECIVSNDTDSSMVGKVASIVNFYNQYEYFKKFAYSEEPIGTIGEREDFFVKLIDRRSVNDKDVFKVVTRDGRLGTFWAMPHINAESGKAGQLDIGDCLVIRVTPKNYEHNKYDKMKMTTFGGRIQIKENVGQTREERHS
jgi:hypothetical protein